jgi:hypothetical protein
VLLQWWWRWWLLCAPAVGFLLVLGVFSFFHSFCFVSFVALTRLAAACFFFFCSALLSAELASVLTMTGAGYTVGFLGGCVHAVLLHKRLWSPGHSVRAQSTAHALASSFFAIGCMSALSRLFLAPARSPAVGGATARSAPTATS